jgi:hypothetical protein
MLYSKRRKNLGGGRQPNKVKSVKGVVKKSDDKKHDLRKKLVPVKHEWMRRIDGETKWTPLRLVDNVKQDVAQIDAVINKVKGGAKTPPSNPYTMPLSSNRILTFNWKNDASVHARVISNIKYNGVHAKSTLWHPKYDTKPK